MLVMMAVGSVRAQVGFGTTSPEAALEVKSADSGILIPRVALTSTNVVTPVTNGVALELVYNTNTAGNVTPGYYYLSTDTGPWVRLSTGAWTDTGNKGTDPATNFLGTTDEKDLVIKTYNTEQVRVNSAGKIGIGVAVPEEKLEVKTGNIYLNSAAGQHIKWTADGSGAPVLLTNRSVGTRLILNPQAASNFADYAIGMDGSAIWQSVPQFSSTYSHKFYGGATPLMTIRGDSNIEIGSRSNPIANLDINGSVKFWYKEVNAIGTIRIVDRLNRKDIYTHYTTFTGAVLPLASNSVGRILYFSTSLTEVGNRPSININSSSAPDKIYYNGSDAMTSFYFPSGLTTIISDGVNWYAN
jgi:hypothetical protein